MRRNPMDHVLPGEHPHVDRPNWQPATTPHDYLRNCREGIEEYTDSRFAKLMGWTRVHVWRARMMAEIPGDLFEQLLARDGPVPSIKELAQIGQALSGRSAPSEVDRCPHCGGAARVRARWRESSRRIVNDWLARRAP